MLFQEQNEGLSQNMSAKIIMLYAAFVFFCRVLRWRFEIVNQVLAIFSAHRTFDILLSIFMT